MKYFLRRNMFFILIGIIICVVSIFIYIDRQDNKEVIDKQEQSILQPLEAEPVAVEDNEEEDEQNHDIIIDIKGEVVAPGVYKMSSGERIIDAISLAGGMTKEADENKVNLAQKIYDEMVIIIPKLGDEESPLLVENMADQGSNKVKINEATLEEIQALNGIGPKKAQAIIDYREEHGPFQHVDDLLQVSGIGEKTLNNFRDDIIVP